VEKDNLQILKGPLENAHTLGDTDKDDIELLGEEEFKTLLSFRQANNGLIV